MPVDTHTERLEKVVATHRRRQEYRLGFITYDVFMLESRQERPQQLPCLQFTTDRIQWSVKQSCLA
jgi:hypothetical protein